MRAQWMGMALLALGAASAGAADSALLVGLRAEHQGVQMYRTLLIVHRRDMVTLEATQPDIVVPRSSGFWRVGVRAVGQDRTTICAAPRHASESERCIPSRDKDSACRVSSLDVRIEQVRPDSAVVHSSAGNGCYRQEFSQSRQASVSLDELDRFVVARDDLPEEGDVESTEAVDATLMEQTGSIRTLLGLENDGDGGLSHRRGRWIVRLGASELAAAPTPTSEPRAPDWAVIKEALPRAVDGVCSPGGDVSIVLAERKLLAFLPAGGRLGSPALWLRMHPGEEVVMAEWALGTANVDRWVRELQK